jgi:hypothetical protein
MIPCAPDAAYTPNRFRSAAEDGHGAAPDAD